MSERTDHIFKATLMAVEEAKKKDEHRIEKVLIWVTQYGKRNKVTKDEALIALSSNLKDYLYSDLTK
jgi:hypothetical protein